MERGQADPAANLSLWEAPRLPPRHAASTRRSRCRLREPGPTGPNTGMELIDGRVIPISLLVRDTLEDVPDSTEARRRLLDANTRRVFVTKEEDTLLTGASHRSSMGLGRGAGTSQSAWTQRRLRPSRIRRDRSDVGSRRWSSLVPGR